MTFQDPATWAMDNLIDLHHDIMFFLIIIATFVAFFLSTIILNHTSTTNTNTYNVTNTNHNTLLEIIWTVIPSLILLIIAIPSFALLYTMESQTLWNKPDLTLKIIGHQWYWGYEYENFPEIELRMQTEQELLSNSEEKGGFRLLETDRKLILPVQKRIRLLLTSDDVIHSWTVPSFAIKVDAVPGRLNQVFLTIIRPGVYYGQCSEICGINHGFMPIAIQGTKNLDLVRLFASSSIDFVEIPEHINAITNIIK